MFSSFDFIFRDYYYYYYVYNIYLFPDELSFKKRKDLIYCHTYILVGVNFFVFVKLIKRFEIKFLDLYHFRLCKIEKKKRRGLQF